MTQQLFEISPNGKRKLPNYPINDGSVHKFEATGYWSNWFIARGPEGYRGVLLDIFRGPPSFPRHQRLCLLGWIDGEQKPFLIGRGCERPFPQGGTLIVFANDVANGNGANVGTNRGWVDLTITPIIQGVEPTSVPEDPAQTGGAGKRGPAERLEQVHHGQGVQPIAADQNTAVANPARGGPKLGAATTSDEATRVLPLRCGGRAVGLFLARCTGGLSILREISVSSRGVPFTILLVYGAAAVLLFQPGRDLLQTAAEDLDWTSERSWYLGTSVVLLALQVWFWTRAVFTSNFRTMASTRKSFRIIAPASLAVGWIGLIATAFWGDRVSFGILVGAALLLIVLLILGACLNDSMNGRVCRWMFGVTTLLVIGFTSWAIGSPVRMGQAIGAPAVVFLALALVVPLVVTLVQWGAAVGIPAGTLLVALPILFGLVPFCSNDVVGRRTEAVDPAISTPALASRINLADAYKEWVRFQDPSNPVMVLVAAQGGASRAGFWTGEALARLDARTGGAIRSHIFAINAVSGGGVGATGYVAAVQLNIGAVAARVDLEDCVPDCPDTPLRHQLQGLTGADALGPALTGMLFPDMFYRFAAVPSLPDRAATLEMAWEAGWSDSCGAEIQDCKEFLAKPFLTLGGPLTDRWTPLLIIQGTHQESGRRILTSRLRLERDEVDALDFYDLNDSDIPISTAIHNGARFPYISPAGELEKNGKTSGHIVDGGYFDAAGVETVRELGRALSHAHPELTILYVLIGYSGVAEAKPESDDAMQLPKPDGWVNEIVAPPLAIARSRPGHGGHLMLELAGTTDADVGVGGNPFAIRSGTKSHYIPLILYDQSVDGKATLEVPMNWTLSSKVREHIRRSIACIPGEPDACGPSANLPTMKAIEMAVDLINASWPAAFGPQ